MLPVHGFDKHLIFYRLIPEGIELIRVYHAARDIDTVGAFPQPNRIVHWAGG